MKTEPKTGWKTVTVKCRICGHEHVAVYPEDVLDEECIECHKCGHMTCGPNKQKDGEL